MNIDLIAQTGKIIKRNPAAVVFGDMVIGENGQTVYIVVYLLDGRKTIIGQYNTEKQLETVLKALDQADTAGRNMYLPRPTFDPAEYEKGV